MQASIHTPPDSKTICLQPCLALTRCYITHKGSSLGLSLQRAIRKLQLSKMIRTSSSMTFLFIVLIWGLQNGSRVKVIATKVNNLRLIPGADMVEGDKQFLQLSFDYHTYSVVPTHPCPHTHMHKCTHTKCNKINYFPFYDSIIWHLVIYTNFIYQNNQRSKKYHKINGKFWVNLTKFMLNLVLVIWVGDSQTSGVDTCFDSVSD